LLVQLLSERQLRPFVFPHLGGLRKAAWALDARRVPLEAGERALGWSSEHHGKDFEAESWPTASVFHFCFELGRLVSDAIRRDVFEYVDVPYEEPTLEPPAGPPLDGLMDSYVEHGDDKDSLKSVLNEQFLKPILDERDLVRDGRSFGRKTKVSAIIYGPPGTSKTRLAGMLAQALGWPLLALDPSHLTRRGLDNVHAEADALFSRLRLCDQTVVLLDEFDELVREREVAGEYQSRFLTTAMLPKIAALHTRRRLVYIVATNHLEQFDAAISRPGRFDVIVPVMPPTADGKFKKWPALAHARDVLQEATPPVDVTPAIGELTYAEAEELAERVDGLDDDDGLRDVIEKARMGATVNQDVLDPGVATKDAKAEPSQDGAAETWKDRIRSQQSKIRGLGF
jgi:ATPase family associated with various cellular activities (AAA)